MSTGRAVWSVLGLAAMFSCQADDQRTDTLDPVEAMQSRAEMGPGVVAQLDSGSAAFRAHDFEGALSHYLRVTELDPEVAAGWFGVYMSEDALGNEPSAFEALERARDLLPEGTLIHQDGSDRLR